MLDVLKLQDYSVICDFSLWWFDYCVIILNCFCLMKAAKLKINEEFRKNMHETSEENVQKV